MDPAQVFEAQQIARHAALSETTARFDSPVQRFYEGSTVLVTGASGFLGKQLVEKLLRSCKIKKIYILLRPKKQKTIEERLMELLDDSVFDELRKNQVSFADKIIPVSGDVTEPHLGISDAGWTTLVDEVELIFHSAATINFADSLKKAVLINVRGTNEVLKFGKACQRLRSFVHISTAYCQATQDRVQKPVLEQFYDTPVAPDVLIQMVQKIDETTLDAMTPSIIKGWSNTYTFTKAVAEDAVRSTAGDLPICILRPAIVICAYREPIPGWIDKSAVIGPSGFILGAGIGILHVLYSNLKSQLDLVPVDVVNNAIIAATYETAMRRERGEKDIKIYTVTGTKNPLHFAKLVKYTNAARAYSSQLTIWYSWCCHPNNKPLFLICTWLFHYIPGYVGDSILFLIGKKPVLMKVYKKARTLNEVFGFYMINYWKFDDRNLRQLYWSMSPNDRTIFCCTLDAIDWRSYVTLWCIGCRKYILKDGLINTDKGIRKQFWMKILNYAVGALYFYVFFKFITLSFDVLTFVFDVVQSFFK